MVIWSLQESVQLTDAGGYPLGTHILKAGTSLMKLSIAIFGAALLAATTGSASAQQPEARIKATIDNAVRSSLPGTRQAIAQTANDAGRMPASTQLKQMTIQFSRSTAQQSALDTLIEDQQSPASAKYHQWLSPDQFGAMFGAADSDIAKVEQWLQSQGFSVGEVSRNRSEIAFSGTIGQVEAAFGTEMHYFGSGGETHFAPAGDLTVPAALANAVAGVGHLNDLKPHSQMRAVSPAALSAHANFTSGQSGSHFVQPGDLAVIYDVNAAYSAGYTGAGQTIVVIGQSAVTISDITNFQTAAGVPVRPPTITLMPGTGVSVLTSGDQSESDLDLEWTSAIAKGATINFIYTGNAPNTGGAFGALQYAITNRIGNIISSSYGDCEIDVGTSYFGTANAYLQQAAAQGQTIISAAGDNGSTDCYQIKTLSIANRQAVAVDFPADSPYVTAMGGTEYPSAAIVSTNSLYFTAASGTDVLVSATSYIPEQVWNDDSATALSSGGGGVSIFAPRPSWQTGNGITAGSFRLVPDISLASSPNNAGYVYCSSDTDTGITGSCSHGFRDVNTANLTVAGGTSFAAPIFAGMLAIINQRTSTPYAGLINPTLYSLAANATTYASAFHDITSGNNACTSPATICGTGVQTTSYAAGTGYDQATGLGSIDLYNLMQAWNTSLAVTGTTTSVTLSAATSPTISGTTDAITIIVTGATTAPTGTVSLVVDGGTTATVLTLTPGTTTSTASYSSNIAALGLHLITVTYQGDSTHAASVRTLGLTTKSPGSFTISAPAVSVTTGTTVSEVVTITPSGGYFGTTNIALSPATITNACYSLTNPTISGTAAVPVIVTINTDFANCNAQNLFQKGSGRVAMNEAPVQPRIPLPAGFAVAVLALAGFFGRRSQRLRGAIAIGALLAVGLVLSGCGSTSTVGQGIVTPPTTAPKGAYTVTVTATDSATGTITASTNFTLTIQ